MPQNARLCWFLGYLQKKEKIRKIHSLAPETLVLVKSKK